MPVRYAPHIRLYGGKVSKLGMTQCGRGGRRRCPTCGIASVGVDVGEWRLVGAAENAMQELEGQRSLEGGL